MRTLLVLVIGALGGAALTYYLAITDRIAREPSSMPRVADVREPPVPLRSVPRGRAPAIAEQLEVYEDAAAADAAGLARRIEAAAGERVSPLRTFRLDVLLTRLAELEPAEAVRLAQALELDAGLAAPLYGVLADADFDAALDALVRIRDAQRAEAAGLAVLEAVGYAAGVLEQVVAASPAADAARLRVAALGALARRDPSAAFERALALSDAAQRTRVLGDVARVWAELDPNAALTRAAEIGDGALQRLFRQNVLRAWAERDVLAALRHASRSGEGMAVVGALAGPAGTGLASVDPETLLDVAGTLDGDVANVVEQMALQALASRDPQAALAYVDARPGGQRRRQLIGIIAHGYARADPEGALAWVRGLEPPMPEAELAVFAGLAQADFARAVELALASPAPLRASALHQVVVNAVSASGAELRRVAETLLAQPPSQARRHGLERLAARWQQSEPDAALDWLVDHAADVSHQAFRRAASTLAQRDPDLAAAYVDRVPDAVRAEWVQAVAQSYARRDPDGAALWIERFRGEPAYTAGVAAVAEGLAMTDPRRAARLLDSLGGDAGAAAGTANTIAFRWVEQDPYAAAQWAAGLAQPQLREVALAAVASRWVGRDPEGARSWLLSLPRGAVRDRALGAAVMGLAQTGLPDAQLLGAFSSAAARDSALLAPISRIAQRDEAAARRLIDEHLENPATRRQAEQMLERRASFGIGTGIGAGVDTRVVVDPNGNVISPFRPIP